VVAALHDRRTFQRAHGHRANVVVAAHDFLQRSAECLGIAHLDQGGELDCKALRHATAQLALYLCWIGDHTKQQVREQ